ESERSDRRVADEKWCAMLLERGVSEFVTAWENLPLFESQHALVAEVHEKQRAERLASSADGLVQSLRATGLAAMPSYWNALSDVRVPVTLVVGSLDRKFTSIAEKMAARIPGARLEVVPGSGHNVLLERPEAVGALLGRALEEG